MEQSILSALLGYLNSWGYYALFLFAFLETAAFIGLFVPGESVVVIGGLLASQGALELDKAMVAAGLGAFAGDTTAYLAARYFGERLLARPRWFLNRENLGATQDFFAQHGGKTVFIGRFTAWLRALVPLAAGLAKMPVLKFWFFDLYGAAAWAIFFTLLGYVVGESWQTIKSFLGQLGAAAFMLAAVIAYVVFLLRRRRRAIKRSARWLDRRLARYAPIAWGFIKERFSLGVWYGFSLTASLVLLVFALVSFAEIVQARIAEETLRALDLQVEALANWLVTPQIAHALAAASNIGAVYAMVVTLAALALYLIWKRDGAYLFALALVVGAGEMLFLALRLYFSHIQPLPGVAVTAGFPSSHAFSAMLIYGFAMVLTWRHARSEVASFLVFTLAPALILLIGFAQIYREAHWFTDVLAGYAAALAWLAVSLSLAAIVQQPQALPPRS